MEQNKQVGVYIPMKDEVTAATVWPRLLKDYPGATVSGLGIKPAIYIAGENLDVQAIAKVKHCEKAESVGIKPRILKNLPRDAETGQISRVFYARDVKYVILSGQEGIGVKRATIFTQALIQLGFARSYPDVVEYINEGLKIMNRADIKDIGEMRVEVMRHFLPLTNAIADHSREQFDIAFWLCTLFVVREDEDLTKWVADEQKVKIEDWASEYSEVDFFVLAGSSDKSFWESYRRVKEGQDARLRKLSTSTTGN